MHFGHTYDNYGPLDYLDVGYKSNGISVGKKDPHIIGFGPIANAPAASESNLGQFYLETGHPLKPDGILRQSNGFIWDIKNKEPLSLFTELPSTWYEGIYPVTG